MKHLVLSILLQFICFFSFGQKNIEFINIEVDKVETELVRKGDELKLTNIQKAQLHAIFEDKFRRVDEVISKELSKLETSNKITKIENEFNPKIAEILNIEQRLVFQKKKVVHNPDSK